MKTPSRYLATATLAALLPLPALAGIDSVTRLEAEPTQYAKTEFQVMLQAEWKDPYDSEELSLDLELRDPSGNELRLPGFYWSGESGRPSEWRLRMSPLLPGEYTGRFRLRSRAGTEYSSQLHFLVRPSATHGFLRPRDAWSFRYDDDTPFRGLGENLCWEGRQHDDSAHFRELHEHPRFNYEYLLGSLAANGGNFFRTWICSWNLPLEWNRVRNTRRYGDDPSRFNQGAMRRLDELVTLSERLGLHLMLTMDTHGSYLGSEWEANAYNRRNGGPADSPRDFFASPAARARYRDRLRLIVARWGYSPAIACWEFFNEVDNLMYGWDPHIPDELISDWHREMAGYLRSVDAHRHMITTSRSHREIAGLETVPGLDFNQHHLYGKTGTIPSELERRWAMNGKPHVIGEFSYEWDWKKNFNAFADRMDRDFERGLWLGLFSRTPVLPLSWWWEYFDERRATRHFAPVRRVLDELLSRGTDFTPVPLKIQGELAAGQALRSGDAVYLVFWSDFPDTQSLRLSLPGTTGVQGGSLRELDLSSGGWGAARAADLGAGTQLQLEAFGLRILRLESAPRR